MLSQMLFRQCASLRLSFATDSQQSSSSHTKSSLSLTSDQTAILDPDEDANQLRAWRNTKRHRSSGSIAGLVIIPSSFKQQQSSKTTNNGQKNSMSSNTINRVEGTDNDDVQLSNARRQSCNGKCAKKSPLAAATPPLPPECSSYIEASSIGQVRVGGGTNAAKRRASATDIGLTSLNINLEEKQRQHQEYESSDLTLVNDFYHSQTDIATTQEQSDDKMIRVNKNLADEMMLSRTLDELHMQQKQQSRKQRLDDRRGSLASGLFEGRAAFNERRKNSIVNQQLAYDVDNVESTSSSANRRSSIYQICPHQYTEDPTLAWEMLKSKRPVKPVRPMKLDTPIRPDHVRFVCIACTHGLILDPQSIPNGDILIVAGDFTTCGLPKEVKNFNENIGHLKHTYKVIIAGNHECTFDSTFLKASQDTGAKEMALKQALMAAMSASKITHPKSLLTNCIYLQDSSVELFGLRIYGSPWQPKCDNWAFNLERGQDCLDKWNQIPSAPDVLVTHTPPLGHGDLLASGARSGCVELLNSVSKRIRPKYMVFGHIHEGYGCTTDGYTKFINCSLCDCHGSKLVNDPIIFDIPIPKDTKSDYVQMTKKVLKKTKK